MQDMAIKKFSIEAAEAIIKNPSLDIEALKNSLGAKYKISTIKNALILASLPKKFRTPLMVQKLKTRTTRTGSGVTPIALMPKPFPCPGKCTYCPTSMKETIDASGKKKLTMTAPKSYTGFEPATMRAIQNKFDAKKQILMRLSQYEALGQPSEKCELIIMGGTFLAIPKNYADKFILQCFNALNKKNSPSLPIAQKLNEKSAHRAIGLTIETRPDWCKQFHIDRMLAYGATRVELGVQSLDEKVLKKVKRGHDVSETIRATRELKDAGFKVCYHFMPGLYSSYKKDVKMLRELFSNPDFCPDMLKIYPCLVMEGTPLHEEYLRGEFTPITSEEAVRRISIASKYFPPWVRIMRMQRDIPAHKITAGVKHGNLHQMASASLAKKGKTLGDIRSREIFSMQRDGKTQAQKPNFRQYCQKYRASGGMEYFLSFEDKKQKLLAGFLRLRLPGNSHRKEITPSTAIVRELHVYGSEIEIGKKASSSSSQHSGFGKALLERAEKIAKANKKNKMIIISGVGTREYYRKTGYSLEGPYMAKKLN
ncbi:tRNA uridine(34) 5-carboxymethylaminomethyl modification radical SAM/GNAT enzyme Elp3 [Candidatus Micrarchaeota archaeon CG10_big_fil_rev_8_21_14_0_10_45_29]|nr:MAG: tRNA uridine(34) 5-carboxymethylaminomethyl modification radical SAM/GNAT enzyme Elp3 [Candidatus Micrarchaeota archaeon CG10_big_fil_rev_8_21_14_0_10_45_29]